MIIRSEKDIYNVLEKHLRKSSTPMTVTALMDIAEVRRVAMDEFSPKDRDARKTADKLSDALGFMWRRGLLTRYPAPKETRSFARFAYGWGSKEPAEPRPLAPNVSSGKLGFTVVEIEGGVQIDFQKFTVTIKGKP